jgi:hypothetical protein
MLLRSQPHALHFNHTRFLYFVFLRTRLLLCDRVRDKMCFYGARSHNSSALPVLFLMGIDFEGWLRGNWTENYVADFVCTHEGR